MLWRSSLGRRQSGLIANRCRFSALEHPKLSHRAGPTQDCFEDYNAQEEPLLNCLTQVSVFDVATNAWVTNECHTLPRLVI